MTWFIWLYVVPAMFILILVLPARKMINQDALIPLYIAIFMPILNLVIAIGVIYSLCTIKDFTPYMNNYESEEKMAELGRQIKELFKDK